MKSVDAKKRETVELMAKLKSNLELIFDGEEKELIESIELFLEKYNSKK